MRTSLHLTKRRIHEGIKKSPHRKFFVRTTASYHSGWRGLSSIPPAPSLATEDDHDFETDHQNAFVRRNPVRPNDVRPGIDEWKRVVNNSVPAARSVIVQEEEVEPEPSPRKSHEVLEENVDRSGSSPSHITYTGGETMPITSELKIVGHGVAPMAPWPVFRIMDENGQFRSPGSDGYVENKDISGDNLSTASVTVKQSSSRSSNKNEQHDLTALRLSLQEHYPFHSKEIDRNALLFPSTNPYPDTNSNNTLLRAHRQMVRLRQMDNILQNAQRQGRISFYMSCRGEEAIHVGSASALKLQDTIFAQYREAGVLMWRGFTLDQFANQCFSNDGDLGRGRQMPVHYGCRAKNYHTISSPLGTQLPQAVGAAYMLKLEAMNKNGSQKAEDGSVAVAFFGDGAASTTDFHSACNFAATLKTPIIFFCRNNGYAISTPVTDQYAGDGIISRAPGYGMAAIRIDGNDVFAVSAAVREARSYALRHSAPVMIEAMTYRQGHHSTSDDSTRYRSGEEVSDFARRHDPISRIKSFLKRQNWMTDSDFAAIKDEERMKVLEAMEAAEKRPPPKLETLFRDVYHEIPSHLDLQEKQLLDHLKKFPDKYNK